MFTIITSEGGPAFTIAKSDASLVTSFAGSIYSDLGHIFTEVTSAFALMYYHYYHRANFFSFPLPIPTHFPLIRLIGIVGKEYTLLTQEGGKEITLARSGGGVATSFAGSVYTIAKS